jgi:two-component system cell cycle sensor histidine kinase/response regulator CckA
MSALERVNILIVDDRPDGLMTLEAVLQSPSYQLIKASSGPEALAHAEKHDFAAILLDVQMPGMDGFQTATHLKDIPRAKTTPILFVTAIHKDPFYIYQGYTLGAVDYIFKPFDPSILKSKVAVFVNLFRQQQQIRRQSEELRLKEEELYQAQKLEAVGRLAGGVAHDFNNLITGILGLSHDLWTTLDGKDPRREDLEEMIKASNRALGLTKQLLAFGRRQIMSPRVLDANGVITDMMKMLKRLIAEDIQLDLKLHPVALTAKIDQGQMEQVIMNLVLNARDAMPNGGRIAISTEPFEYLGGSKNGLSDLKPGSYILIQITDSGFGMDPQTLEHIFEPYYTTKEKEKGTGLGLATVYGVVMQWGGHIDVHSQPGKGTQFKIYIPKVAGLAVECVGQPLATEGMRGGDETILVVEDENIVRQVTTRILRKNGYTVFEAKDSQEALDISETYTGSIHLMITDVVMPGMNGRVLAERLRPSRPDMHVLYMSGYTEDVIVHRGVVDTDIAFIEKTFAAPQLLAKVREVIDRRIPENQSPERIPVEANPSTNR